MTVANNNLGFVVAAGGSSTRFGTNKLLEEISGIPVFCHCLKLFLTVVPQENIVLVVSNLDYEKYTQVLQEQQLSIKLVKGGANRQDSVLNGVKALPNNIELVAVHDAARPFLTAKSLNKCIECARKNGSAVLAHKIVDTVKEVDEQGKVVATLVRDNLRAIETPQIFPALILKQALMKIAEDKQIATDESTAIQYFDAQYPIIIVENEEDNRKITYHKDLNIEVK